MNRVKLLLFLLFLSPVAAFPQYRYTGIVVEAATGQPLAGTNVLPALGDPATADEAGKFSFTSDLPKVTVTFSFIGYITITVELVAGADETIELQVDEEMLSEGSEHIKIGMAAGYHGDLSHAPVGLMMNAHLQSIGTTRIETTAMVKHANYDANRFLDVSVSKYIHGSIGVVASNIFLSYKKIDYRKDAFNIEQLRGIIVTRLPWNFGFDSGIVYNRMNRNDITIINDEKYFSGYIGLSHSIAVYSSFACTLYGSLTNNGSHTFYDLAVRKNISIGRNFGFTASLKYYDYEMIQGWMAGVSFRLFSSEYYCCSSWYTIHRAVNILK